MEEISLSFQLEKTFFIERPNRFLIRCRLENSEQIVEAHLADSGRLGELLIPGRPIWLTTAANPVRKTRWTAVLTETPDGKGWVSINSSLPNRLIGKALAAKAIEELAGWDLVKGEYTQGNSRWDFLLAKDQRQLFLEVKGVSLVRDGIAYFPDAVTARGAKHLRELARIARSGEGEAAVLFLLQRDDASLIRAARDIDRNFSQALTEAREAGVIILGRKCEMNLTGMKLQGAVAVTS